MNDDHTQLMSEDAKKTLTNRGDRHVPATSGQQPYPEWQETEEIQLSDYLDVILRRKWLIATVLALVFLSTLIFTLAATRIYEASAVIEVSQDNPNVTSFKEIMSSEIQAREFYETQVELLGSRAIIDRLIDKLDLASNPVIKKVVFGEGRSGIIWTLRRALKSMVGLFRGQRQDAVTDDIAVQQQIAEYLSDNLSVTPSRKSMLISVAFRSPDRQFSQLVVNNLIEDYINWKMELKVEASGLARDFLMLQMDRAKINLEKAEERLNAFAKHAGIVSLDAKINSIYRHLEELNSAFAMAEADMISKEANYTQALKEGHSNLPQVLASDLIASLKNRYAELSASYEELKTTFHDDFPRVQTLKARMDNIAALIKSHEEGIFLSIASEYESAKEVVSSMEKRIEKQKEAVLDLNDRATQYSIMEREVETNKAIYQSLLQRAKEIESMAGVTASNIQIVNRAALPLLAVKPNVKLNLLLSIILGLIGGMGCAFLAEYFSDTLTHPGEITDRFNIPLLGTIPQAKPDKHGLENTFLKHPRSAFSEAIRSARVSVQLSGSGKRSKCFLITSTLPSEGKTTLAINLALSFAAAGEKTVIIDVDLRKPRLHQVFNLTNRVNGDGITSFLAGVTSQIEIFNDLGRRLSIIPSGPIPPNPAELLASKRFQNLLKQLNDSYDRIILDGPPHIGFADTLILSKQVGGIVLISSIGESSREAISQFKKSISNVNGVILGCVVNKMDFNRNYGYSGYYKAYQSYSNYGLEDEDTQAVPKRVS